MVKEGALMYATSAVKEMIGNADVQHYGFWCHTNFAIDGQFQ